MISKTATQKNRSVRPAHPRNDSENSPDLDLARGPGNGSNDWTTDQREADQYRSADLFPVDAEKINTDRKYRAPFSPARTSFGISGQPSPLNDPTLWTQLKQLQHDVGRDYTDRNRKRATIRRDYRHRRYDAILQSLEVPDPVRHWALRKVFRTDISGFNAHYNGYHGAVLGFAPLALTDNLDEALTSNWFGRIKAFIDELPDADVNLDPESLAKYVFENYGHNRGGS